MFRNRHKMLSKIVALAFAVNSVGWAAAPVAMAADSLTVKDSSGKVWAGTQTSDGWAFADESGNMIGSPASQEQAIASLQQYLASKGLDVAGFTSTSKKFVKATGQTITESESGDSRYVTTTYSDGSSKTVTWNRLQQPDGSYTWKTQTTYANPEGASGETVADRAKAQDSAKAASLAGNVETAKSMLSSTVASVGSPVIPSSDDDDLQFMNKVIALSTDTSGKTSIADNYAKLVAAAEQAKKSADEAGTSVNSYTQQVLDMDERVQSILTALEAGGGGSMDASILTDTAVKQAKATYQTALAEQKLCKAKAAQEGRTDACEFSDAAKSAMNMLLLRDMQQINSVSSDAKTVNATGTAGSASEKESTTSSSSSSESKSSSEKKIESQAVPKCYEGTVLASDGKCCPTATPIYDSKAGSCKTATTETKETSSNDDDDDDKSDSLMALFAMLGMGRGTAGVDPNAHTETGAGSGAGITATGVHRGFEEDGSVEYMFNYHINQNGKITYLPANSDDDIQFKLLNWTLPKGITGNVTAEAHVKLVMSAKNSKGFHMVTVPVPLTKGEMTTLFPKNIASDSVYSKYAQYGSVVRVKASEVGMSYYTMEVVLKVDGKPVKRYIINYDFTSEKTFLAPNPNWEGSPNVIVGSSFRANVDGYISGASWENGRCMITVDGVVKDSAASESASLDGIRIASDKVKQSGCETLNTVKGRLTLENVTQTDDGKGNVILTDDEKSKIYMEKKDHLKPEDLAGSSTIPVTLKIVTDHGTYEMYGVRTDGHDFYDENNNIFDGVNEANFINKIYGTNYATTGACEGEIGKFCAYRADGTSDVLTSADGFEPGAVRVNWMTEKEATSVDTDTRGTSSSSYPVAIDDISASLPEKIWNGVKGAIFGSRTKAGVGSAVKIVESAIGNDEAGDADISAIPETVGDENIPAAGKEESTKKQKRKIDKGSSSSLQKLVEEIVKGSAGVTENF